MSAPESIRFEVEHTSRFRYNQPAHKSIMSVRLHPRQDRGQRVLSFSLTVTPTAEPVAFADSFGNICHLFDIRRGFRELSVSSHAEVELNDIAGLTMRPDSDSWVLLEEKTDPVECWEYLNPSTFVRYSTALAKFMDSCSIKKTGGPIVSMTEAALALYTNIDYEPGSTAVDSPIDTVLDNRRGVCQDYTHVLLAIGRSWGIPCRYVSGYLRLDSGDELRTPTGESHAWVEFLYPGSDWIGIDPTNNTMADHRYVRVAVGRDYADVPPTKGIVFGTGGSIIEVQVIVDEVAPKSQTADTSDAAGGDVQQ